MLKHLLVALLAFFALSVFAADANNASQADLEAIKGIGPAIATKIVDERKNGAFKDWPDLITRVKGIGDKSAAKLSSAGLTVNGAAMSGAPAATPAPAKTTAPATKVAPTAPATAAAPVAPAKPAATPAATTAAPAAPASSAKELKKAAAAQAKADKASAAARKKADKAAAKASAASAARK